MTFAVADRVWETSTSTGTSTFTLLGAVTGYRTFSSVLSTGPENTTYYCITDGTNWEVGRGYLTSSTNLIRSPLSSSNSNNLVNFPAGTKQVFITQPASQSVLVLPNDNNPNGTNTSLPPIALVSSSYWTWQYDLGCNTYFDKYAFIVAGSVIPAGSFLNTVAYSYETEYGTVNNTDFIGFKSVPTTAVSVTSNGNGNSYGFYAKGITPNAGGFRFSSSGYCFYADSSIGFTNSYQFYAAGTDKSYFGGKVDFGSTVTTISSTSTIGYATTAGGTQTQLTNKSTGVTLNKICGQITMNAASLAASTSVSFTLTNSAIAATDVVIVNVANVGGAAPTVNTYQVDVDSVLAGSCRIHLRNVSGVAAAQAVVLNFAVIKAVAA
jgi:hypothetical protein